MALAKLESVFIAKDIFAYIKVVTVHSPPEMDASKGKPDRGFGKQVKLGRLGAKFGVLGYKIWAFRGLFWG